MSPPGEDPGAGCGPGVPRRRSATTAGYCGDLRSWMLQVQQARCMEAMFPIWLSQQLATAAAAAPQQGQRSFVTPGSQSQPPPRPPQRGIEFRVPPIWKRVVAEMIDFFILMIIKVIIAYIAIDTFELIDISKYDVETLLKVASGSQTNRYSMVVEMTAELLMIEMVNRVSVCWFEALCIHRGWGTPGGATPGKYLLGLRVVRCEWLAPSLDDHVVLAPGEDIGFSRALLRSIIKNVTVTFFAPMLASVAYLDHNRTPHDLLSGTVVVENARR